MNDVVPVLACKNIKKQFRDGARTIEVLKDVNLSVAKAERVAILGPSGSGKSTLLHLLGGLDKPTSGDVFVEGVCLNEISERRRCRLRNLHLGFVYQFHHLLPEFSALENVAMPLLIQGLKPAAASKRANEVLAAVDMSDRVTHRLGQLSGGERQRVAIARALVTKPSCLLADEPTGNLDHNTANKVYDLMLQLNRDFETSFIIVTHDVNFAKRMDRILYLEDGVCRPY